MGKFGTEFQPSRSGKEISAAIGLGDVKFVRGGQFSDEKTMSKDPFSSRWQGALSSKNWSFELSLR